MPFHSMPCHAVQQVLEMFQEARQVLVSQGHKDVEFQLQFAVYRNYK